MKEEDLVLTDMFGKKMQPIEWLQYWQVKNISSSNQGQEYELGYAG